MKKIGGLWGIDNTKSDKYTDFADEGEKTFQKIAMITRDPQEAIKGADVIMIFIQTQYHEALAKKIAFFLRGINWLFLYQAILVRFITIDIVLKSHYSQKGSQPPMTLVFTNPVASKYYSKMCETLFPICPQIKRILDKKVRLKFLEPIGIPAKISSLRLYITPI